VTLAPESALAHSLLGLHYRRTGQAALALEELERALEIDPDNPALVAEIAGAHEALGDYEQAEEWYRTANLLAPDHPDYALLLAQFYVENEIKLAESGRPAAQRAVELAPDSAAARDALGFAHILLGDVRAGDAQLRIALELDPQLASANYHMGVLLASLDDREGAVAHYRRALELEPQGRYGNLALRALALLGAE
jgi:tetratricopeptide (TPR) repeat protein